MKVLGVWVMRSCEVLTMGRTEGDGWVDDGDDETYRNLYSLSITFVQSGQRPSRVLILADCRVRSELVALTGIWPAPSPPSSPISPVYRQSAPSSLHSIISANSGMIPLGIAE